MNFVKFTEHNDNEGESWNFWLQLDGNEKELQKLQSWLETFDDNGEEYEIDMTPVPESEVDILVKHTDQGYMNYQNKVTGKFTCPNFTDEDDYDSLEVFYKGDIVRHFKNVQE